MSIRGLIEGIILAYLVIVGTILFIHEEQRIAYLYEKLDNADYHYSLLQKAYFNSAERQQKILDNVEENYKWYDAQMSNCQKELNTRRPIYLWEQIAGENADLDLYVKDQYDCTQFAKELRTLLKQEGYEPVCVYGKTYEPETKEWIRHDWVELPIYIEATTGIVITPEDLKQNYEIIQRGVCR